MQLRQINARRHVYLAKHSIAAEALSNVRFVDCEHTSADVRAAGRSRLMTPSLSDRRQPKGRPPKIVAREFCATGEQRSAVLKNILSPKDQAELAKIATVLAYQTGGFAIYSEGEDAHFLYLIDDGMVRLSRHLPNGSRQVLGFMWPGDFFGLAEEGRYVNAAEPPTRSVILRFPIERRRHLLLRGPLLPASSPDEGRT